jgi:hypothetical protein
VVELITEGHQPSPKSQIDETSDKVKPDQKSQKW